MDKHTGIVAIARKLLVVVWHVLTEQAADSHANADLVAFKLRTWSWKLTDAQRSGQTTRQFVRAQLASATRRRSYACRARRSQAVDYSPRSEAEWDCPAGRGARSQARIARRLSG